MQALSFAVHIPLVCFGIAFPAMVLLAEWRHLRTGDELYRTLARRWTRVMVALFAVGAVTGTILSFEMGLLWPDLTATFGAVFGLGFRGRGLLVLPRGDLHRHLRLRLGPAVAALAFRVRPSDRHSRHDRFADGDLRERLDAASQRVRHGVRARRRRSSCRPAVRQTVLLARARAHVPRGLHRHTKLAALEGVPKTTRGAPEHLLGGTPTTGSSTGCASRNCSRSSLITTRTRESKGWVPSLRTAGRR